MKLDHLNLSVEDVAATQTFLQKYFGLRSVGQGGVNMAFLSDDNHSVITLMKAKNVRYPDSFHIGFVQPGVEQVNALYQRLKDDGVDVPPPQKLHGSWTFYVPSPGGFTIEVQCWLGQ
ncbi:VOC family protein [Deinococcus ruber]|uniref:Glyoxalase n=1 Tax=Deinococcus ruber TaxID=1848197 RepID=A0A918F3W5_9DEIO|nr:VOC family protein [Deinococcus ruber]GGR02170.1 glyoxalase [Deinococcus ruber]